MPIESLRTGVWAHDWGNHIYAKIEAINAVGASATSPDGNGALILTYPDAPVNLANDPSVTSTTQIKMTW